VTPPTQRPTATPTGIDRGPSSAYRAEFWRAGLFLARHLPAFLARPLAFTLGHLYALLRPSRLGIVEANLAPLLGAGTPECRATSRRLFAQFAAKVLDLWRCESGMATDRWMTEWSGWERFVAARERNQGVLLVTPHIGNWEFGGPFLSKRGIKLLVLTQPEPGSGFTELRQASRAQWGIETIVVRNDPFAFVDIIKRLQDGAIVALLVDRPPAPTGVTVELFGRPFQASIAAAELARATGAAILPVYVVHGTTGYKACVLPEVAYSRAALGNRESRRMLTQEIMRAFEPVIREHPDQWYHFVPLWPEPAKPCD
jgi:KDO2-lipid IV(A) lauroyltransferase